MYILFESTRSSNVPTCDVPEPVLLWAIYPLLLLVHICGTIYRFISVTLNYRLPSFAGY